MREKDLPVMKCSVSESRYFGLAYAHVVIPADQIDKALQEDFWPAEVRAREWRFALDKIASASATS